MWLGAIDVWHSKLPCFGQSRLPKFMSRRRRRRLFDEAKWHVELAAIAMANGVSGSGAGG